MHKKRITDIDQNHGHNMTLPVKLIQYICENHKPSNILQILSLDEKTQCHPLPLEHHVSYFLVFLLTVAGQQEYFRAA